MPSFEIVTSDPDLKEMTVMVDEVQVFISQFDTNGKQSCTMLNKDEAKQVAAVLASFLEGRIAHTSDCALYSSPAYPIEPCTCSTSP